MNRIPAVLTLIAALSFAHPALATPVLPDTPIGRALAAWFDAMASRSRERLEQVARTHFSDDFPVEDRLQAWSEVLEESGTVTPVRVVKTSAEEIVVLTRDAHGQLTRTTFRVAGDRIRGIRAERARPEDRDQPAEPEDRSPLTAEEAVAAITRLADSLAAAGRFSGVVRLERGGRVELERAWGMADRAKGTPNTPGTTFNLGSINKTFTRALIAKLAEEGRLSPEDRLSKHLPDFPRDKADRITIQQLLDMKSGLGDFARYDAADKSKLRDQRDWFPLIVDQPLLFEPGTGEEYSNAGYCVLGAVAEAVTGRNYYDLVREHIYEPAGMKRSGSFSRDEKVANRAEGYTRRAGGRRGGETPELQSNRSELPWRGSAAGGGYSTAADLSRYVAALRAEKIVSAATLERFFGARRRADGKPEVRIGIAGGSPGVNAVVVTPGDWTVIVLSNLDPPSAESVEREARRLVQRVVEKGTGEVERGSR